MQYDSVNKKKQAQILYHDLRKRVHHPQHLVFVLVIVLLILVIYVIVVDMAFRSGF